MRYRVQTVVCIVTLLLSSACFRGATATSHAGHDSDQMRVQSTPAPAAREQKERTQKELAQLAINSGNNKRTGLFSNAEYGYAVTIPKGLIGVSPPSPYPQHGFRIPLLDQPEAQIWVDGSYNAAMYTSLSEAAETDFTHLRDDSDEVEVSVRESMKLQNVDALRVIAKYKNKFAGVRMIQDLVIAIRRNAVPDGPDVIYTIRLRTPESRYFADKDILNSLISTWRLTPLGQ